MYLHDCLYMYVNERLPLANLEEWRFGLLNIWLFSKVSQLDTKMIFKVDFA